MKNNKILYFILLCLGFCFLMQISQAQTNKNDFSPVALLSEIDSEKSTEQLSKTFKLLKILAVRIDNNRIVIGCTADDITNAGFTRDFYDYAVDYAALFNKYVDRLRQMDHVMTFPNTSSKQLTPEDIILATFVSSSPEDGMPLFTLSRDDAQKIGISDEIYDKMTEDMNQVEMAIKKSISEGAILVKHQEPKYKLPRTLGIPIYPWPVGELPITIDDTAIKAALDDFARELITLNQKYQ